MPPEPFKILLIQFPFLIGLRKVIVESKDKLFPQRITQTLVVPAIAVKHDPVEYWLQ